MAQDVISDSWDGIIGRTWPAWKYGSQCTQGGHHWTNWYPLHSAKWATFGHISSLRSLFSGEDSLCFPDCRIFLRKGVSKKMVGWWQMQGNLDIWLEVADTTCQRLTITPLPKTLDLSKKRLKIGSSASGFCGVWQRINWYYARTRASKPFQGVITLNGSSNLIAD